MNLRRGFVLLHRYVGLAMALFLVVAGLTGSLLAFFHELDAVLSPSLYEPAAHSPESTPLDPFTLRESLESHVPGALAHTVPLDGKLDHGVSFFVRPRKDPETGRRVELANDEYFVDPYTGELLGSRKNGDIRQGFKNLMPFVYRLHISLALGEVGSRLFGLVALLWTIDCFVGAYLTFPPRRTTHGGAPTSRNWWSRWLRSWVLKTGSFYKLTFTWHQACGLWVWAMLLVFAWSAVGLNLRGVYDPIMTSTFGMDAPVFGTLPKVASPREGPKLPWRDAYVIAQRLMGEQAAARGFKVLDERRLRYDAPFGLFRYQVRSSLDVSRRMPSTTLWFSADTGEFVAFEAPTGGATGNSITSWLYALHFAGLGGRPYQVFVCLMGVIIAALSVSGVYIWWKKRLARSHVREPLSAARPRVLEVESRLPPVAL